MTDNQEIWACYVQHDFLFSLGRGDLPKVCFQYYLGQDYLFLIHLARSYALAAYKSESLTDIRQASHGLSAIVDLEMDMHVKFCMSWGLSEADMEALSESSETLAYTRYVLEKGLSGDLLDLHVALAPCIIGYAEIGRQLAPADVSNPYADWINLYASADYQKIASGETDQLDLLFEARAGEGRYEALSAIFAQATQLEVAFWQASLDAKA